MTGGKYRKPRAFTLVELLVVIAIIGLLASILMPSLSKARELAKAASCLSNLHNLGLMMTVYTTDNERYYPVSYNYVNGAGSGGGYYHWSAALEPTEYKDPLKYPRSSPMFVCPSHLAGGWAPTNFTPARIQAPPAGQQPQSNTLDDKQAPRISYIGNEIVMGRKKFSATEDATRAAAGQPNTASLCYVNADEMEAAASTILLSEFSDSANGIYGTSSGGGAAYKSHRPTSGVATWDGTNYGVFDGEGYTPGTAIRKLQLADAEAAIVAAKNDNTPGKTVAAAQHHIAYINPEAHGSNGSNYTFSDGHAAKATLRQTLDPGNYMWGRKVYSCADKPVIED